MIVDLFMTCRLGDEIDESTRYLEVDRLPSTKHTYESDRFPAKFWTKMNTPLFMKLKKGSLIALRGRLETDAKCGIFILIEQFECLSIQNR